MRLRLGKTSLRGSGTRGRRCGQARSLCGLQPDTGSAKEASATGSRIANPFHRSRHIRDALLSRSRGLSPVGRRFPKHTHIFLATLPRGSIRLGGSQSSAPRSRSSSSWSFHCLLSGDWSRRASAWSNINYSDTRRPSLARESELVGLLLTHFREDVFSWHSSAQSRWTTLQEHESRYRTSSTCQDSTPMKMLSFLTTNRMPPGDPAGGAGRSESAGREQVLSYSRGRLSVAPTFHNHQLYQRDSIFTRNTAWSQYNSEAK